jgi:hypothetical protein
MDLKFEQPLPITKLEVEDSLANADSNIPAQALIRMALWETDWVWAERMALRALEDPRKQVKMAALVAIAHLARLHHRLHLELVLPAIKGQLHDPDCGGTAQDALDDIALFINKRGPSV